MISIESRNLINYKKTYKKKHLILQNTQPHHVVNFSNFKKSLYENSTNDKEAVLLAIWKMLNMYKHSTSCTFV